MLKAPKVVRRVFTFITHGHKLIGISPDTSSTVTLAIEQRDLSIPLFPYCKVTRDKQWTQPLLTPRHTTTTPPGATHTLKTR